MEQFDPEKFAITMAGIGYDHWPCPTSHLTSDALREVCCAANDLAVRLAMVGQYANMRGGLGYGDRGHTVAITEAEARRVKVRKALGYSYPEAK